MSEGGYPVASARAPNLSPATMKAHRRPFNSATWTSRTHTDRCPKPAVDTNAIHTRGTTE